ncbi:MAG: 3-dehydroquinate synthase II [Thermoplasmata archaeon]|nr:3-dehydroquinate synthase II [Thermoplasmata archaeon]
MEGECYLELPERIEALGGARQLLHRETVRDPSDLDRALGRLGQGDSLSIRFELERVLPLESLIAHRGPGTVLWVEITDVRELPAALGALERGADSAVVRVETVRDLDALAPWIASTGPPTLRWTPHRVSRIAPMGNGDRVLVDTTSLLGATEGLPVGSSAARLLLVLSEAVGSRVTRPRPFRVNAGAPHSYTLLADGDTRYLSELEAGDALLVGGADGAARAVRVGRLKIERRPMLLIEVESPAGRATIFVQEAETVRLHSGTVPVPVTELAVGDQVLAAELPPARHLGRSISEHVEER